MHQEELVGRDRSSDLGQATSYLVPRTGSRDAEHLRGGGPRGSVEEVVDALVASVTVPSAEQLARLGAQHGALMGDGCLDVGCREHVDADHEVRLGRLAGRLEAAAVRRCRLLECVRGEVCGVDVGQAELRR